MARTEIGIFRHPGRELARTVHTVGLGVRRHWKSLMFTAAAVSIPAALAINHYIGLNSQGREITKVSDPYKPADTDSGIVIVPATATAESSPTPPPPEPTATAIPTPESIDPAKCVFIKEPEICALGQPRTREGWNDQVLGVEYSNIPNTQIYTKKGYFSVAKDNSTQKVVGVSIDFEDGSTLNIRGDDLEIPDPKSRPVEDGDIVAKIGKSGNVSFSTDAKFDPETGQYVMPKGFFESYFPSSVLKKTKKVLPVASGNSPAITITKRYE